MAKETDGQTLRDYGKRKKRYRRRRAFLIITLLLCILILGLIYLWRLINKSYANYEVVSTAANAGDAVGYLSYGSAVVKYSRDGAVAIDRDETLLWNGSYEMNNPIADTCGKFVVIADQGNKDLKIFNGKGLVNGITTLHNIIKVEVAGQGVVAVLMQDGDRNYITVYNKDGSTLWEADYSINNEGYPIDIALSEDGRKLVVSFYNITSGELVSSIGFYNLGEVGKNEIGNLVGGDKYEGILIPRVTFLNNDTVCVYKEKGIMIYSMLEVPRLIYEEDFERNIKSILYSDKYAGLVVDIDDINTSQLILYNLKGEKVLNRKLDFTYDKIQLAEEEIIMHDDNSCIIMKTNGKIKFSYTFPVNVDAFYPNNHLNRYYLINGSEITDIVLVE